MIVANGKAAQFLGPAKTADYRPSLVSPLPLWSGRDVGWYSWHDVEWMRRDPQCQFGLRILRGPLATVTWEIPASSPEVAAWVDRTLRKVWTHYLNKVTAHLEYGSCGGELTWRYDRTSDLIELDELLDIHILDMKPLQQHRKQVGIQVNSSRGGMEATPLLRPRYWWIANEPEFGAYHGRARLAGAWIPWQEKTARHGARDVRRLWYVKNVMDGGTMYHPPGETLGPDGRLMANVDYAREMMEKGLAGGVRVFPNVTDEKGKRLWEYESPKVNGELTGVHEHMRDLDREILIGLNIPPEVVDAADTGSGWSGRSVPFLVFLTSEDQLADTTVQGIDKHALRPGVAVNFGEDAWYEIRLKSLVKQAEEQEAKKEGQQPGAKPGETAAQGQEQKPGQPQAPQGQGQAPGRPQGPVRMSVQHAPPGGISIGGQDFKGGEFIPGDVLAKATKQEKAALKAAPKANSFDKPPGVSGGHKDTRQFYKTVNKAKEQRPAHPDFHHPSLLRVESRLHELVSEAGHVPESLYFDQRGRFVTVAGIDYDVMVVPQGENVIINSFPLHGPDPREPNKFVITPDTPSDEVEYRLRKALDLPVSREEANKYKADDRAVRESSRKETQAKRQERQRRKAAKAGDGAERLSIQHAPAGGVSIGGKDFAGGEFIPDDVLAKATPEERAALEGKSPPPAVESKARSQQWQDRNADRQQRRQAAENALLPGNADPIQLQAERKALEEDPTGPAAQKHAGRLLDLWESQVAAIRAAGASEKELAKLEKTHEKVTGAVKKKLNAYGSTFARARELDAAATEQESQEPQWQPTEGPAEPDSPSEESYADPAAFQQAYNEWEKAHDEWEKEQERWEKDQENAEAAHEKAHERWERKSTQAREKAEAAEEKANEGFDALTEALDEADSRMEEVVSAISEKVTGRLDEEEEGDPEPEDEEEETPPA